MVEWTQWHPESGIMQPRKHFFPTMYRGTVATFSSFGDFCLYPICSSNSLCSMERAKPEIDQSGATTETGIADRDERKGRDDIRPSQFFYMMIEAPPGIISYNVLHSISDTMALNTYSMCVNNLNGFHNSFTSEYKYCWLIWELTIYSVY